jgi:plastocyanin
MKTRLTKVRGRLLVATVLLIALAAVVAACGSSSSASNTPAATPAASAAAASSSVSIQNFAFTPKTLTVSPGTTVTWTNNDSAPHNVISTVSISVNSATTSTFASSTLSQGQTFSFTFAKKGVYFYECSIHKSLPAMHAEVIVK